MARNRDHSADQDIFEHRLTPGYRASGVAERIEWSAVGLRLRRDPRLFEFVVPNVRSEASNEAELAPPLPDFRRVCGRPARLCSDIAPSSQGMEESPNPERFRATLSSVGRRII
jgi:hypothetical protein